MDKGFEACGVITITTDFGHKGPFIGTMKGVMLSRFPQARIIDLTHETLVHWPAEAGFWIERAFPYFPVGSVHVGVVDPGVGTGRDIIGLTHAGHAFLAPDNGLLANLAGRPAVGVHKLAARTLDRLGIARPSATFHGRDIFAPLAAELAAGHLAVAELGPAVNDIVPSWLEDPVKTGERVSGVVVTVDHFGNLITNIDATLLDDISTPVIRAGNHAIPFRRTYGDARPGEYLALINSFGVLEIARAENSAAEGLGLGRGAPVTVSDK